MNWRRVAQWITGSLLVAALAAACGGDDADPTATTTATVADSSPTPSSALLRISGLTHTYPGSATVALAPLDFDVRRGEIV